METPGCSSIYFPRFIYFLFCLFLSFFSIPLKLILSQILFSWKSTKCQLIPKAMMRVLSPPANQAPKELQKVNFVVCRFGWKWFVFCFSARLTSHLSGDGRILHGAYNLWFVSQLPRMPATFTVRHRSSDFIPGPTVAFNRERQSETIFPAHFHHSRFAASTTF